MKYRLFTLVLTFSLLISVPPVHASFWVKKQASLTTASQTKASTSTVSTNRSIVQLITHPKNLLDNRYPRHRDTSGWEGIVSLVCGIIGLFTFYPAIPAIVFGILGLRKDKEHRGMALAGLIIGVFTILLWVALVVLFVAAMTGGL